MRVLLVDLNGPFGPLRSFADLIPSLRETGIDVTVLTPETRADGLSTYLHGAELMTFEDPSPRVRDLDIVRVAKSLSGTTSLIHANSTSAARGAALAALQIRRPLVVHLRNSALSAGERRFVRALRYIPITTRFVAVSASASAVAHMDGRSLVIPDPVVVHASRLHGPPAIPARIGIVANQQPTKGLDIAVAIAALTKDLPVVFEVFGSAGADPLVNPFISEQFEFIHREGLEDRLIFHGEVPDLADHLGGLDVMLITSRRESFSRVAAEAMLTGLPLVAPMIPGLSDTIDGGRWAVTYNVADARSAARALRAVLEDPATSMERACAARAWANDRFAPGHVAERMAALYRNLAG